MLMLQHLPTHYQLHLQVTKKQKTFLIYQIDYILNEHSEYVGLKLEDNIYYFDFDIFGNISGLVDESGNEVVKYDVVFHDSYHFEEVIPELVAFWFYKVK